MHTNPFARIRALAIQAGLPATQQKWARDLDITPQVIMRLEHGVYVEPSDSLLQYYITTLADAYVAMGLPDPTFGPVEIEPNRFLVCSRSGLKAAYLDWQSDWRASNYRFFQRPVGPFKSKIRHPHMEWRQLCTGPRVYAYCKLLAISSDIVVRYETGRVEKMPEVLMNALLDAGVKFEDLMVMKNAVRRFVRERLV